MKLPRFVWKFLRVVPVFAYAIGLGPLIGRLVLLLTTIGRKSGQPRVTPLVYEERDGVFLIASARGPEADWLHNIQRNPNIQVRVGRRQFAARAELVTDATKIADYLGRQLIQNPGMFGRIMQMEGLSRSPSRAELESVASRRPMVLLRPVERPIYQADKSPQRH